MKKVASFFLYSALFVVALIIFLPKTNLFYLAEEKMKEFEIIVSNELIDEKLFGLNISSGDIYFKQIESAKFENIDIGTALFYSEISAQNITLSSTFADMLPTKIESITITHSVFDPLKIKAVASGEFGSADIDIFIQERKISASVEPSKIVTSRYPKLLNMLKKSENGGYVYEYNF